MNEIAEAANVSTPHLYNFYASKAALALAVQLKMGQETFDALKTAMSAGEKNPSCQSIFDSRRSSLMLTILTEWHAQSRDKRKDYGKRRTPSEDDFGSGRHLAGRPGRAVPHSLRDGHVPWYVDFQHLYAG